MTTHSTTRRTYRIAVGHAESDPVLNVVAVSLDDAFAQARQQHPGRALLCLGSKRTRGQA